MTDPPELRPWGPGLVDEVTELLDRADRPDRLPEVTGRGQLVDMLSEPWFRPEDDARVVVLDGAVVGWGRIWHQPAGEGTERVVVFGAIDPARRGRGLGSALLEWQVDRASAVLAGRPGTIRLDVYDWQADVRRLAERTGFRPVRTFEDLVRPLDPLLRAPAPEGVQVVPWDRRRDEETRRVRNVAFGDHWGSPPVPAESWTAGLEGSDTRLDLSFLALSDARVLGYLLAEHSEGAEAVTGRREGWIASIGVLPAGRRRGVATALIAASLEAFAAAGFTHAALRVGTENESGAARLYRTLGFRPLYRTLTYTRPPR